MLKANFRRLLLLAVLAGWVLITKFENGKLLLNGLGFSTLKEQIICEEPMAPVAPPKNQIEELREDADWQLLNELPLPMPVPGSVYPMNSVVL